VSTTPEFQRTTPTDWEADQAAWRAALQRVVEHGRKGGPFGHTRPLEPCPPGSGANSCFYTTITTCASSGATDADGIRGFIAIDKRARYANSHLYFLERRASRIPSVVRR